MIARPTKTVREQMNYWERTRKIPFLFTVAKGRCYLAGEAGNFMTDTDMLPMRELHNIKMVKDHILKNQLHLDFPKVRKKDIKYFMYNKKLQSMTPATKCYEVDLNHAYWEMANKLVLLREDIYRKADAKDPETGRPMMGTPTRLACIGSLARRRSFYEFNGFTERRWKEPISPTAHLWDYICLEVSNIMQKGAKAAGKDFCFFWVDAAFVTTTKARDKVLASFKKSGFKAKIRQIDSIEVVHEFLHDTIKVIRADKTVKNYPYSKKNRNIIK